MKKNFIPELSGEELNLRAGRIQLLLRQGEQLHVAHMEDLKNTAFNYGDAQIGNAISNVEIVTSIQTYHGFSHWKIFRPTVEEVLAQIPMELLDKVHGFEVRSIQNRAEHNSEAWDAGFHTANTMLYKFV